MNFCHGHDCANEALSFAELTFRFAWLVLLDMDFVIEFKIELQRCLYIEVLTAPARALQSPTFSSMKIEDSSTLELS